MGMIALGQSGRGRRDGARHRSGVSTAAPGLPLAPAASVGAGLEGKPGAELCRGSAPSPPARSEAAARLETGSVELTKRSGLRRGW